MYFYACSLTQFLAHDNPERGIVECVKKSIVTMKGNKLRLMVLDLTFIGWWLLCYLCALIPIAFASIGLPIAVGYIFYFASYIAIMCHVLPYWTTSRAHFYKDLMDTKNVIQDVLDDPEEDDNEDLNKILNGHQ